MLTSTDRSIYNAIHRTIRSIYNAIEGAMTKPNALSSSMNTLIYTSMDRWIYAEKRHNISENRKNRNFANFPVF